MKLLPITITGLLLLTATPAVLCAKERKSKKSSPVPTAPDTSDRITALHLTAIIVTIYATHQSKEYKVTPGTRITVNGQPSQLSGLATGMDVSVMSAADGVTAATIDAKTRR